MVEDFSYVKHGVQMLKIFKLFEFYKALTLLNKTANYVVQDCEVQNQWNVGKWAQNICMNTPFVFSP